MARIPNGYAKRHHCRAEDFEPDQVKRGIKVEFEHTTDAAIARQIALDHLCEDRNYYRKLAKIHENSNQFGAASCSTSPRWLRGSVGFLIGTLLGGMVGGGVAVATANFDLTEPLETLKRTRSMALIASGITIVGAIAGLTLAARKPEC